MANWTEIATLLAGIDSGDPGIGAGGWGEDLLNNLQYLKDLADGAGVACDANIHDDFVSTTFNTVTLIGGGAIGRQDPYTWLLQGTTMPSLSANPDHYAILTQGGGVNDFCSIAASDYKMAFDLSRDHTLVMEMRHKSAQSDIAEGWRFGFQDQALILGGTVTMATGLNEFMGFIQGTGVANTYRAQTNSGGAGPTVVVDNYGNAAAWTMLRIEVTKAGATNTVEFFVDDVSVGVSSSNISIVRLRPQVATNEGGGVRIQHFDKIDAFWKVRPLSA